MAILSKKQAQESGEEILLRELFYGSPKTRKTWLAGTAAEAGFNTILLDSDHGYHILLQNLSEKAKQRLMLIEARDSLKQATAAIFMTHFLKFGSVNFNEKTREVITSVKNLDQDCINLSIERHLAPSTVLIIDSYSALVRSIAFRYAIENKVDLTDPSKTDWDGYAWCGALASWMLDKLTSLPCHVIVIGHKSVYEKRSKDQKTIEWVRTQIKSTSGPHSMTIGEKFSDILYFENLSSAVTKISTRAEKDAEGGSRIIKPGSYDWEKLTFDKICEMAGIPLPASDLPYLDFSIQQKEELQPEKPTIVLDNQPKTTKISALLGKKST